jgi:flagellar hook-length control protein FliK
MASNFQDAARWFSQLWANSAETAATGRTPGSSIPSLMLPTLDIQELDKRIADLRSVEGWLELNLGLLRTTMQSLELQKQTLQTWQGFQTMGQTANATGTTSSSKASTGANPVGSSPFVDPKTAFQPQVWWDALQTQFSQMAAQAAQSMPKTTSASGSPKDPPGTGRR